MLESQIALFKYSYILLFKEDLKNPRCEVSQSLIIYKNLGSKIRNFAH